MTDKEIWIQTLINKRAKLLDSLSKLHYVGTIEIKDINGSNKKYIYLRKREFNKIKSIYVGPYTKQLNETVSSECNQAKEIVKQIRHIEHELAKLGYNKNKITNKVLLNIDIARANFTNLIYDQGVLEVVTATYAQTQTILDNGVVNGVSASDMLKIVNLKSAWDFILDKDVILSEQDFALYATIAKLVNDKLLYFPNHVRTTKSKITGCKVYEPPIPVLSDIKETFNKVLKLRKSSIDIAIDLCLYCMKSQIFNDGNKRCAVIFANHYLISKGQGLLIIDANDVEHFRNLLIDYYDYNKKEPIIKFLKGKCWIKNK